MIKLGEIEIPLDRLSIRKCLDEERIPYDDPGEGRGGIALTFECQQRMGMNLQQVLYMIALKNKLV